MRFTHSTGQSRKQASTESLLLKRMAQAKHIAKVPSVRSPKCPAWIFCYLSVHHHPQCHPCPVEGAMEHSQFPVSPWGFWYWLRCAFCLSELTVLLSLAVAGGNNFSVFQCECQGVCCQHQFHVQNGVIRDRGKCCLNSASVIKAAERDILNAVKIVNG